MNKNKVIVIAGPTASGKTSLAIEVAKRINGEIISCDSIQIYKYLNIGSAKATLEEQCGIKHYLIDIVSPDEEFSTQKFQEMANQCIFEILRKGKVPIVCGGTGLFLRGLIENYTFCGCDKDEKLRSEYNLILKDKGQKYLYELLLEKNPVRAKIINPNDTIRTIRALEIESLGGTLPSKQSDTDYDFKVFCLDVNRDLLYERINSRVDKMFDEGLVMEVEKLCKQFKLTQSSQSMKGIGYKEVIGFLNKQYSLEECKDLIKQKTRNYAKRQLTWFRHMDNVVWVKPDEIDLILKECE